MNKEIKRLGIIVVGCLVGLLIISYISVKLGLNNSETRELDNHIDIEDVDYDRINKMVEDIVNGKFENYEGKEPITIKTRASRDDILDALGFLVMTDGAMGESELDWIRESLRGEKGDRGIKGNTGDNGVSIMGDKGEKGDPGEDGARGPKSEPGW